MIFPFVNWFRRDVTRGINFNWKITDHLKNFERASQEYDSRINDFERHLQEAGLFEEYIQLRNAASRVNHEWSRVQFTSEIMNFGRPKDYSPIKE